MKGSIAARALAALLAAGALPAWAGAAQADRLQAASPLAEIPAPASLLFPARGPVLGVGSAAGVALARSPYWPLNAQMWGSLSLSLEVPLASFLGLGFSLGFRGTGASPPSTGVLYRGHYGLETGAYLDGRVRMGRGSERLRLRGGILAGASAALEVYGPTELLFYYPSLQLEPYLELYFPRIGAHTFSLSLPARLDFRRDLELSACTGLGLRWRWYPRHRRQSP